ncbi:sensor histidine kinase [Stenotrophomonas rhizophila]|uniref:sensor histidine kinase n=1 Tax=Stenotrophomonas rhizophila TaxID=216778 RepID=UPI001E55AA27|nr:sensor histidine kinase [Stenotrophomonas rhizophila]MCC7633921.1 histidine kinase [Stenotrophomonas rhizophila]MCC7663255.1 histidine kinase [Stenotrophomonas rhizophila]
MPAACSAPAPARTRRHLAGRALWWLLLAAWPALGANLSAYEHTAWVVGQGAPGDVWDIGQDTDGSLLLATGNGLYRFDGRQFERREPPNGSTFPSSNMTTLALDPDGTLWIAYYNAGISRLDRHGLTHYAQAQGVPPGLVPRIERDGSGRLWAAADGGLRWFDGQRWQRPTAAMGIGDVPAQWLLRDAAGTLWVIAAGRLWRLPAGATGFEPLALTVAPFSSLALRADGRLWLADRQRGVMPVADAHGLLPAAQREAQRLPGLLAKRIRFSRDGRLWGSLVGNGGIFHVDLDRSPAQVEYFDAAQGLASTTAVPVAEDREGNVWVGTNLGLNRFRQHPVHALALPGPADPLRTLYQAPDGQVFAYGQDLQPMALRRDLLQAGATALHGAALASSQPLWLADWEALAVIDAGQRRALDPPGLPAPRELRAVLPLGRDEAWFCFGNADVLHYRHGRWRTDPALPAQACTTAAGGPAGELLLGYPDGSVRLRRQQQWRHYTRADGLAVGPVTATSMIGARLWVGGENGLAVLGSDGRFHALQSDTPGVFEGITGIVRDRAGRYWLNGSRGLARIDAAGLEQALRQATPVQLRLFDTADGMPGIAAQTTPVPSAVLAADGLLWLSTNQGLAWLDTQAAQRSAAAPLPRIGNIAHGRQQQPLRDGLLLPAGTTQLQIDYMAVSLTRPERTRYRYRLSGLDERWQDAGTLTRAFYTNLGPGNYRFEVMAANQDGAWSSSAAQRSFRIAPMWYQTLWFNAACVLLLLGLILLAMRLRSRRLTQLVRARLQERHAERERIARELHDTLLQGTQGLILRLHAVSQASHTPPPVRAALEAAMQQAEHALAEARERVGALREDRDGYQDLGAALVQVYGERASDASSPALRLNVEGAPVPLRRDAAEEVYLIGREAVLNALQHAAAGAIEIEIGYGLRGLRLHIRDDGNGLPAVLPDGHWGLVGMRERAERLGARLRLWSRPGLGTEVELFLPRHRIYRRSTRRWRWPGSSGESA